MNTAASAQQNSFVFTGKVRMSDRTTPHAAPTSVNHDHIVSQALETLENVTTALNSLRDLLVPAEDFTYVDRDTLAMMLLFLDAQCREAGDNGDRAASARLAVVDLVSPSRDLHIVSRDHLCALVDLLAHLHANAVEGVREAVRGTNS